uniref:U4/U6.U5 small nuclear ribonucleoprotein 27 kDa protein n=1 Tax=Trichobilharzia regenti TaxID=157069 RepID=A0AA85IR94_TRIRE|nr:unnamed protein product [Trichobilharzia regenti]
MSRDHERRARSRSHDRHRDRGDVYAHSGRYQDRRDHDYDERDVDRDRHRYERERRDRDSRRREEHNHSDGSWRRPPRSRSHVTETEEEVIKYAEETPAEPETDLEAEIMRTMGFCCFNTTKGKRVVGNSVYIANIMKQQNNR